MSNLSPEFLTAINTSAWVGKTLSVALAYSPSDPWDDTYDYGDISAFLIADGTVGMLHGKARDLLGDRMALALVGLKQLRSAPTLQESGQLP